MIDVIVGGQFGSESKGRVTLDVVRRRADEIGAQNVVSARVAGPNAGHVVIDPEGRRFAMRALPVGFVEEGVSLWIAPGSEVDLEVLRSEVELVESYGYSVRDRLYIDPEATWLEEHHREREASEHLRERTGSTGKGIGAARADRIMRTARRTKDGPEFSQLGKVTEIGWLLQETLVSGESALVIEGTQGYGLGLHAGYYPQCTSSDARAIDFLAMAGISPWVVHPTHLNVWVVIRCFPIRVAGNSGPLEGETSWAELGLPEEHTTVTGKVRRVGQFDPQMVADAVRANGTTRVSLALAMLDQRFPEVAGMTHRDQLSELPEDVRFAIARFIADIPYGHRIAQLGTGPDSSIWVDRDLQGILA